MHELTPQERAIFRRLSTPIKIQDYLDTLPANFEKNGETHYSPRSVFREKKAHCIEGALIAAAALWFHGHEPLLMDFTTLDFDEDHVVAPYKLNGYWGAISKTNHAILRFRDPVYRTIRELALSYFHEYFMFEDGRKTLKSYSTPLNLKRFGASWITAREDVWYMDDALNAQKHFELVPKVNKKYIRPADHFERAAGMFIEWKKTDRRT